MSEKIFKIINGDSLEELKKFPDNYFDSVVTDPPYGLGKEPNATEMLKAWIETGYMEVKGGGFMGKEWDAFVPQPLFWKEVFRVLKHGGHVVSFFGTRTYDWGVMAMRLAGFEIRDSIQFAFDDSKYRDEFINSLTKEQRITLGQILKNGENIALWNYGSGFPKSHNISKAIDKMYGAEREVVGKKEFGYQVSISKKRVEEGYRPNLTKSTKEVEVTAPSTDQAKEWDGWGSALKPAVEPIVLARKPLEKGLSIAENVLKWGTGGINIDGCRVGKDLIKGQKAGQGFNNVKGFGVNTKLGEQDAKEYTSEDINGRFPANLLMSHHPDCCFNGMKKVGKGERKNHEDGEVSSANEGYVIPNKSSFTHKNSDVIASYGEETIEDWSCVDGCPIKIMDEQSGESKSSDTKRNRNTIGSFGMPNDNTNEYNDKGGASRFFYTAKASKSERNFGLDGFDEKRPDARDSKGMGTFEEKGVQIQKNFHPTVKPLKIIQYLVRLITPPNGKVLDPFNGSGTTGIACSLEGFEYTGIELDTEYCKISEARITAWNEIEEYEQYKKIIENQEEEKLNEKLGVRQTNLFED